VVAQRCGQRTALQEAPTGKTAEIGRSKPLKPWQQARTERDQLSGGENAPSQAVFPQTLRRVSALDETLFISISNSRAIVDFRNLLAHDYGAVDDDAVFGLVYSDLMVLKSEVSVLLGCLP